LRILEEYKFRILVRQIKDCVTTQAILQLIDIFFLNEDVKIFSSWFDKEGSLVVAMSFQDQGSIIFTVHFHKS